MQRFRQAGPLTWLLAAVCGWALLLWLAALLGMGGRVAEASPAQDAALPQPVAAKPDRIGPLAQYAEAASRPLFTEDRRPRAFVATGADDGAAGSDSNAFDYILTGVLISPQARLAILQPSAGGASQRVRVGNAPEGAAGWHLLEVQPRRAVFDGPSGQMALDLRTFGVPGLPPGSVRPAEAADAAATAADAAASAPPPPPPADEAHRVEDLRRRIELRRTQLQQQTPNTNNTTGLQPLPEPAK